MDYLKVPENAVYRVENDGCAEGYEALIRPDGSDVCVITEPEDRNFNRDLKPVIDELNGLLAQIEDQKRVIEERRWLDPIRSFGLQYGFPRNNNHPTTPATNGGRTPNQRYVSLPVPTMVISFVFDRLPNRNVLLFFTLIAHLAFQFCFYNSLRPELLTQ